MRVSQLAGALALGLILAAGGEAAASGVEERGRCAVQDPSLREQQAIEAEFALASQAGGALSSDERPITVPVYFHVVTTSTGGADVSALVPAQMSVLAAAFAGSGVSFQLMGTDVVANDDWFYSAAGSVEEVAMKAALRQGGPEALNIYTTNGDIYLGWATFPIYYNRYPAYDGVVLYWATLPGTGFNFPYPTDLEPDGEITYDQGDTGTHEVGHWLGLYHTFQGGCSNPGDYGKDTPAELEPNFFCAPFDSCTGKKWPGLDPINNFMDYTDDVCLDRFSADQGHRMRKQWKAFRG